MKKLKDVIRRPDFNPEDYGGFMFSDFQFSKFFFLWNKSIKDVFDEVNDFLSTNGYDTFEFEAFEIEMSVQMENVSLYSDPYVNDSTMKLVLIIDKFNPLDNPIDEMILQLVRFRNERDWNKFHNPKDLALALSIEASELLELFLWKDPNDAPIEKIKEELADVFAYGLLLAEKYGLDVSEIVFDKIQKNEKKYPIEKSKGSAKKYDEL